MSSSSKLPKVITDPLKGTMTPTQPKIPPPQALMQAAEEAKHPMPAVPRLLTVAQAFPHIQKIAHPFLPKPVDAPLIRTTKPKSAFIAPKTAQQEPAHQKVSSTTAAPKTAQQEQMPAEQKQMPAQQEQMPAQQEPVPAQQEPVPAQQAQMPAKQEQMPAQQEQMPAQQDAPMPAQQEQIQASSRGKRKYDSAVCPKCGSVDFRLYFEKVVQLIRPVRSFSGP